MIKIRYDRFLFCLVLVIFTIVSSYIANFAISMGFLMPTAAGDSQTNTLVAQERSISSNQSEDIKAIRNSMSEQVQLLKNMTQGFAKSSTETSFAALGVFLLGMTLLLYGLRLTVRAIDKETSRYFRVMMWALMVPVIAILAIYQVGILTGISLRVIKIGEPFFFISLILWIPAGIIIFLLMAERRVLTGIHKKQP